MAQGEEAAGWESSIPFFDHYFQSESATTLANKLRDVSGKWKNLGIQLGLSDYALPQEKPDRSQDYFREMLYQWLRNHPPTTQSSLLRAVRDVQPDLAMKLEPKYSKDRKLNSTNLPIIMEYLHKLVPRWRQLGRKLKLEEYELDVICNPEDNEENLITVLHLWMRQKANDATLLGLYRALINVEFKYLAEEIIEDTNITCLLIPQARALRQGTRGPIKQPSGEEIVDYNGQVGNNSSSGLEPLFEEQPLPSEQQSQPLQETSLGAIPPQSSTKGRTRQLTHQYTYPAAVDPHSKQPPEPAKNSEVDKTRKQPSAPAGNHCPLIIRIFGNEVNIPLRTLLNWCSNNPKYSWSIIITALVISGAVLWKKFS